MGGGSMDIRSFFGGGGKKKPTSNSTGTQHADPKTKSKTASSSSSAKTTSTTKPPGPTATAAARKAVTAVDFFASAGSHSDNTTTKVTPPTGPSTKESKKTCSPLVKRKDRKVNEESDDSVIVLDDTRPTTDSDPDDGDDDNDDNYVPPNQSHSRASSSSSPRRSRSKTTRTLPNDSEKSPPVATKKRSVAATSSSAATAKPAPTPIQKKPKTTSTPASSLKKNGLSKHAVHKQSLLQHSLSLDSFSTDDATPQCLLNCTFVLTGNSLDLSRDAMVELIKTLGGRVTTAVSKNTDYLLVCGPDLEDGRPVEQSKKYQRAVELGGDLVVMVQGVKQFYGLLQQYSKMAQQQQQQQEQSRSPAAVPAGEATGPKDSLSLLVSRCSAVQAVDGVASMPPVPSSTAANPYASSTKSVMSNPYATRKTSASTGTTAVNPYAKRAPATTNSNSNSYTDAKPSAVSRTTSNISNQNQLWVDRYKPTSSREILGNESAARQLKGWLQSWERVFNKDDKVGKSFAAPQGPWKAALLSGPPGIGKTTTATLVAMESGRDVLEFNASDVRSKKAMQEAFGDITGSQTLQFGSSSNSKTSPRQKRCIIMDEVDGMGAGDRSGLAELIQLIKHSRVPIICICNDRQSQKMKSLLPYCMDLRYKRPVKSTIVKRALEVASREGLVVEPNAAEAIVESCGNDVRQVLNCLQMWASNNVNKTSTGNGSDVLTYKSLKEREHSINKDEILRVSLFDAAKTIVEGRRGLVGSDANAERSSFMTRNEAFFVDYSFMGLLVQQNYLKVVQGHFNEAKRRSLTGGNTSTDPTLDVLERMHQAADAMSDFAVTETALRGGQNWSLLPTAAMLAVKTGYQAGGETGGFLGGFPEFTTWLGRNSTRNKKLRLLGELGHHMNYRVSGGTLEIRLSYLPVLRDRFLTLLTNEETHGGSVSDAIGLMDEYGLDRDDIFEKLDEFKLDSSNRTFAKMDSKTKAAFTRTYNAGTHRSQALVAEQGAGKKSKRGAAGSFAAKDPDAIDDDEADEDEKDPDDEDDDELNAEKVKALFASKKRGRKATGAGGTSGKAAAKKPRTKTAAATKKKK